VTPQVVKIKHLLMYGC